jgi:hypothetical protein
MAMDSRIEMLKEKYWAGETTLAEEKELKQYFAGKPSLSAEGRLFRQIGKETQIKPEQPFVHPSGNRKRSWLAAAAVVVLLLSSGIFLLHEPEDRYAVKDPQEAYEITRASLMKVSEGLNKGRTYTLELEKIEKAKETITY